MYHVSTSQKLTTAILVALVLPSAAGPLGTDMYLPAWVDIAKDLSTPEAVVQLTLTAFMIGMGLGQLFAGPISDGLGRKKLLVGAALIFLATSIGCALAPSIDVLVLMRIVQGLAGGAGAVLARAIIPDLTSGTETAKAFSLLMSIQGIAPALAPVLGGIFMPLVGWRGIFWILAGFNAATVLVSVFIIPETKPVESRKQGAIRTLFPSIGACLKRRVFLGYLIAFCCAFGAMFCYISASPFVFQSQLGLSAQRYSIVFAVNSLMIMAFSIVSSRLVGRVSPRPLMLTGLGILAVASVGLLVSGIAGATLWATIPLLMCAIGSVGFVYGNATALATNTVRDIGVGAGSGVLGFAQFLTAGIVAPLVGLGSDHALSMAIGMCVCAAAAISASLLLTKPESRGRARVAQQ